VTRATVASHVTHILTKLGYDDGDLAEALELTTVHQPLEESGLTAARLLLERVHAAGTPARPTRNVSLRLSLTVRGTT
jgi:DNA-binding LacI/PurR family transcriptional regulator